MEKFIDEKILKERELKNRKNQTMFEDYVDLVDSDEVSVYTLKAAGGKLRKIMHDAFHASSVKKHENTSEQTK